MKKRFRIWKPSAGQKIAAARFARTGRNVYPDANSQLRISYGRVLGYEEDTTSCRTRRPLAACTIVPASFDEKPPYDLPERFKEGRLKLDLTTPMNFVYTADTLAETPVVPSLIAKRK